MTTNEYKVSPCFLMSMPFVRFGFHILHSSPSLPQCAIPSQEHEGFHSQLNTKAADFNEQFTALTEDLLISEYGRCSVGEARQPA